jgi:hypothetical protein
MPGLPILTSFFHDSTICGELFEKSVGNYPLISPGLYLHAMLHLNDINISTHKMDLPEIKTFY